MAFLPFVRALLILAHAALDLVPTVLTYKNLVLTFENDANPW